MKIEDVSGYVIYGLFAVVVIYQVCDSTRTNRELRKAAKAIQDKLDNVGGDL